MRNKYTCDLCKTEITEISWFDAPSEFKAVSYCASQNPLGKLGLGFQYVKVEIKDVCQACQKALASTLTEKLAELGYDFDSGKYPELVKK